jgi:hypothetical protein
MAPDGERVVNSVDASRRDFLRKIIAGAAFAPPLIASFNLDGLSLTDAEAQISNQCLFSNQTIGPFFFDFSGAEYEQNFRDVRRGNDINPGTEPPNSHPALKFTGATGAAGDTWITVLDEGPGTPAEDTVFTDLCLVMSADIIIHPFNNTKGVGLLALFNEEDAGDKGLALVVLNQGNSDRLALMTVNKAGNRAVLSSASLGRGIQENAWYRLNLSIEGTVSTIQVEGSVLRHATPTDPDSPLAGPVGAPLSFNRPLPVGVGASGQVGLVAVAINAVVNSSVTNFTVTGSGLGSPPIC